MHAGFVASGAVARVLVVRDWVVSDEGYLSLRVEFRDGSTAQFAERYRVADGQVIVEKYRFHWQTADGSLIRRWDNAPHHPAVSTFPHHVHEGREENVRPHAAIKALDALRTIEAALAQR